MSSSYLDLYTGAGGYYGGFGGNQLMQKPTIGVQQGTYRAGQTTRVVHDTLNNKYYGTQKQSDLVKGLQDSIARSQESVKNPWGTNVINAGTIFQQEQRYKKSAQEIADMNTAITNQQSYLKHIQNGGYQQGPHGSEFFKSYDAHTGAYNNIYQRTYNNTEQEKRNKKISAENARKQKEHAAAVERNRLQAIENDKIAARNQKIKGEEEALEQNNNKLGIGKNKSRAKPLKPNLTIGTGIVASAYRGLNNSGLSI